MDVVTTKIVNFIFNQFSDEMHIVLLDENPERWYVFEFGNITIELTCSFMTSYRYGIYIRERVNGNEIFYGEIEEDIYYQMKTMLLSEAMSATGGNLEIINKIMDE